MPEPDDNLSPGEEHISEQLLMAQWAYDRFLLEWRALYAGRGKEPSTRELYLDAEKFVSSEDTLEDVLPGVDLEEKSSRAHLFYLAANKLSETLEVAKAEWAYNRDPGPLNEAVRRMREGKGESS